MRRGGKGLALAFLAALVLFFCLFSAGAARADSSYQLHQDTSKWAGTLDDLSASPVFKPKIWLSYDGKKILDFIPIPTFHFDITFSLGVECDFDLDIRQGTMSGITENDRVDENTPGLSREKISDNIFDYLRIPFVGVDVESFIRVGATAPVRLKGHLRNVQGVRLSSESSESTIQVNEVEFTSVRPKNPGEKVIFYVGTEFNETLGLGEIDILGFIGVGPLVKGEIGFIGGALGSAILEKDKVDLSHLSDSQNIIHTCTENGREGCVSGSWRNMHRYEASVGIHLTVTLGVKIPIYEHDWTFPGGWTVSPQKYFVQSLTWGEPLKTQQTQPVCSHRVFKVPAALWYDNARTQPVRNWPAPVHTAETARVDPNVRHLTSVVPNADGKVTLYLPSDREGKGGYTLATESGELGASAKVDSFYVFDWVTDLILGSSEQRKFTVKKEWDIDVGDKDRPESIQVLLERSSCNDLGTIDFNIGRAWRGVQVVTLNPGNQWYAEFDPVPAREVDEQGKWQEIKYRVRELREPDPEDDTTHPDDPEAAERRVIQDKWDLDNTHLWEKLKGKVTDWNTYWQITPSKEGLKSLLGGYAKESLFPDPEVSYTVPAYTNLAGKKVDEHQTLYRVKYEEEEGEEGENPRVTAVTITDTAIVSVNIYKRWINLGDAEPPDTVYIALLCRPQEAYRDLLPASIEKFAGLWLPVFKPLSGDNINVLSLVGLDALAKLDVAGLLKIPVAIAKVSKPEEGSNPLTAWRCGFVVKKYGTLGIDGIPVEFEGAEVTSVVIQDLIKFLTGIDFPVSFSLQGFVTVPGKAYQIPYLDKNWEKTSNIINIKASSEDDPDDPTDVAIGGLKRWEGDSRSVRPDSITLHIKDGNDPVADLRLTLVKGDENTDTDTLNISIKHGEDWNLIGTTALSKDDNVWPWALKKSDLGDDGNLDPNTTYTVTEDPVDGYFAKIEGHDIVNTYTAGATPRLVIRKIYSEFTGRPPQKVEATLTLNNGQGTSYPVVLERPWAEYTGVYEADATDTVPANTDFTKIQVREKTEYSTGYKVTCSGPEVERQGSSVIYTYTITNHPKRDSELVIQKKWVGDSESERPESVNVTVKRDGVEWNTFKLNKSRNWSVAVSGTHLRKEDGTLYDISVQEEVPEGYTCSVSMERSTTDAGRSRTTYTLTNTWIPETDRVAVTGKKTWVDDGTHPDKITIHIRNNKNETVKDLEVSAADNWTWTVANLPGKDAAGNPLAYSVTEDPAEVPDSGNAGGSGSAKTYYVTSYKAPVFDEGLKSWICNITNTHPEKLVLIKVKKVWKDNEDALGHRPESVKVRVYEEAGGGEKTLLRELELNADYGWETAFWTDRKAGAVYSLEEDHVEAYDASYDQTSGNNTVSMTVTNTLRDHITVQKVWKGDSESDRPEEVLVRLKNEQGETVARGVLKAANGWQCEFNGTQYPIWDDIGDPIFYELTEESNYKYYNVITGSAQDGFVVTNTLKKGIKVTKVWWDNNNAGHTRPDKVSFHLTYKRDQIDYSYLFDLSASQGWTRTLSPQYYPTLDIEGKPIKYTLTEDPVDGYRSVVTGNAQEGFTVINLLQGRISITKRWVDDLDEEEHEHFHNIIVQLTKKNTATGETTTHDIPVFADENWTAILDPDEYPVNGGYTYQLKEYKRNGYTSVISGDAETGFLVTNTKATMRVSVHKDWKHGANPVAQRPQEVKVRLIKMNGGGFVPGMEVTLNAANNWQYTFEDLPFLQNGKAYSVEEVDVPQGYTPSITQSGNGKTEYTSFTITDTYEKQTLDVPVTKVWVDNNVPWRPEEVTVRIRAKEDSGKHWEATLNGANNWKYTFKDLPVYYDPTEAHPITYIVEEVNPPQQYDAAVTGDQEHGFTVTNTVKSGITITKVWNDDHDESGERPAFVTVHLNKPGGETVTKVLDDSNFWSCTLNLPLFNDQGGQIQYTLTEDPVPGYYSKITGSALDGFVITNMPKGKMTITKVWNDDDNAQNTRPGSVTVHLKNTGGTVPVDADLVLSAADGWTRTLDSDTYPVYDESGSPITYQLTEATVPQYNSAVTGNAQEGFAVINTLKNRIIIAKRWVDGSYEGRPASVTVYLKREDVSGSSPVPLELKASENWMTTLNADDYPVSGTYTLTEEPVNGYTFSYIRIFDNFFIVTNTRATMPVSVQKVWEHGANPEAQRPQAVTVRLKKGNETVKDVTLSEANHWKYTFEDMPFLRDGTVYSVEELNVPRGYMATITKSGNGKTEFTGFTITDTYVKQTLDVPVVKVWDDDDVSWRPAEVTVRISAKEDPGLQWEATLNKTGNWTHTFTNLPVYHPQDAAQTTPLTYTVEEVNPLPYYDVSVTGSQTYGFTVKNTASKINIRVNKVWADQDDALGNRPETVLITLRANGGNYLSAYLAPDSSNQWTCLFEDLPRYEDSGDGTGVEIDYTLLENDVPGYTSSSVYEYDESTRTGTFTLTNSTSNEHINLDIVKEWAGEGKWQSEYRPSEVKLTIAGGGKVYPVTLRASEGWKAALAGLPRYVNGKEASYFLQEWDVNGYKASAEIKGPQTVDEVTAFTYTLTNTLVTTDIPVTKYWLDEESAHPAATFILYSNKEAEEEDREVARLTLTEQDADASEPGNPWRGKFTGWPVFTSDTGRAIRYTLQEVPIEGYGDPIILRENQQGSGDGSTIYASFEVYNYPLPGTAEAFAVKYWEDDDNALGFRPREVITHLWNGDEEVAVIPLAGEDKSTGKVENLPLTDEEGRKITYTLTEDTPSRYDSDIQSVELEWFGRRYFFFLVRNTLQEDSCVLTYDPNGGELEGSTDPLQEEHRKGEVILIRQAPVREGYRFLYWKGSEYQPGDEYTVTGDHVFVAQWEEVSEPTDTPEPPEPTDTPEPPEPTDTPEPPEPTDTPEPTEPGYDFKYTFTKKWSGGHEDSISWTLYSTDGNKVHKKFNKKVISNTEWRYEAWFASERDYYIIETPPEGYKVRYENTGAHADVTDRCYNGGTIINYKIPKTGDNRTASLLWIGCVLLGLLGIGGTLFFRKRGKGR